MSPLPPHRSLFRKVVRTLAQDPGFARCRQILVGLSGGADSTVLLHLLCAVRDHGGPQVVAAHVHHGLRGTEADRDAKCAEKTALLHGCDFHVLHLRKGKIAGARAEHDLREGRLELLARLASATGCERVALGHHRDDQAETVLFRILGGADLRGLSGIRVFRPPLWVRPLLNVSREEILREAASCRLRYVTDSTNRRSEPRRNYLRKIVIPMLEREFNPRLSQHLVALSRSITAVQAHLETMAEKLLGRARISGGGFKASVFAQAPDAVRSTAIQRAFREVAGEGSALRRPQLEAVDRMIRTPGRTRTYSLPRGVLLVRDDDRLEWRRID